ncbi:MAG: IMPACT family protein [Thermovirgaceae bacterium]
MNDGDVITEPARGAVAELRERRSRFIASLAPATGEEEAKDFIRSVSREHSQASHNCWAYRVGPPKQTEYFSDAGEPSGTAGKPILGAIQRAGLTNTVIVVTRYFGGVKLGVRGLIEAYGTCASLALEKAGRVRKRLARMARIVTTYEHQNALLSMVREIAVDGDSVKAEYGASVTLCVPVPLAFASQAEELFAGCLGRGLIASWRWEEVQGAHL